MDNSLFAAVRRYVDLHPAADGVVATSISGLAIVCETRPTALQFALSKPLVALLLQGNKRLTLGTDTFDFGSGESLLITTDVPTVSQITRASFEAPYFSLVIEIDTAIVEGLVAEMGSTSFAAVARRTSIPPTPKSPTRRCGSYGCWTAPRISPCCNRRCSASCISGYSSDGMAGQFAPWV
jgi:hypothetical protein